MLNKFSNIASVETLEDHLNVPFHYGDLYHPARVINGKKENAVALMTSDEPSKIQFGIWGILPSHYYDDWKQFQCELNTLETSIEQLKTSEWLFDAFKKRRCLIMATGFFTSKIVDNALVTFYHSMNDDVLFCFAGIYNVLEDGFITFSILTRNFDNSNILETTRPIVLDEEKYTAYLTDPLPLKKLIERDYEPDNVVLSSHQYFKNDFKNKKMAINFTKFCDNEKFGS